MAGPRESHTKGSESEREKRISNFNAYVHMEYIGNTLYRETLLEKEMAARSSTLAWKIPWMEEPGGLPSMGLHRARHD